jgi:hypothetical protein
MGREPEIEKILEAWRESDNCAPHEKAAKLAARNFLLDAILSKSVGLRNRQELLNCLYPRYNEYRKSKKREESVQVSQSSLKPN